MSAPCTTLLDWALDWGAADVGRAPEGVSRPRGLAEDAAELGVVGRPVAPIDPTGLREGVWGVAGLDGPVGVRDGFEGRGVVGVRGAAGEVLGDPVEPEVEGDRGVVGVAGDRGAGVLRGAGAGRGAGVLRGAGVDVRGLEVDPDDDELLFDPLEREERLDDRLAPLRVRRWASTRAGGVAAGASGVPSIARENRYGDMVASCADRRALDAPGTAPFNRWATSL